MKRLLPILLLCLAGCASRPSDIVVFKETVFGLDISSDPSTQLPHVRFGLVRNYFIHIPTTNGVAPAFSSHTDATIGVTKQTAVEDFKTGPSSIP